MAILIIILIMVGIFYANYKLIKLNLAARKAIKNKDYKAILRYQNMPRNLFFGIIRRQLANTIQYGQVNKEDK